MNIPARIKLDGWQGIFWQDVVVVGETPQRYRITPAGAEPVRLAGRMRYCDPGATALVPKHAVVLTVTANDRVAGHQKPSSGLLVEALERLEGKDESSGALPSGRTGRRSEDG